MVGLILGVKGNAQVKALGHVALIPRGGHQFEILVLKRVLVCGLGFLHLPQHHIVLLLGPRVAPLGQLTHVDVVEVLELLGILIVSLVTKRVLHGSPCLWLEHSLGHLRGSDCMGGHYYLGRIKRDEGRGWIGRAGQHSPARQNRRSWGALAS